MYRLIPEKVDLYTVGIKTHKEPFKDNVKLKTAQTKTTIRSPTVTYRFSTTCN